MQITKIFKNILAPPLCCGCKRLGTFFCEKCRLKIEYLSSTDSETMVMAAYRPPLASLITNYKYYPCPELAPLLATLLDNWLPTLTADYITAVPIHPQKLKDRGFNQVEKIAKLIAKKRNLAYKEFLLKIDHSPPQATLNRSQRLAAKHIFIPHPNAANFYQKTVILLDDVITTGSTMTECERVMLQMGVTKVIKVGMAKSEN